MEENVEFSTFEGRNYANPTLSRDEQLSFIDTLRETQAKNTAQINADTYALGSQLPSQLGGLSGAEDTFIARYQTPQTNQTVANLRQAAQQSALNTALSNLQNAYKKRYNDAVLKYQKRAATPSNSTPSGDVGFEGTTPDGSATSALEVELGDVPAGGTATVLDGELVIQDANGNPVKKKGTDGKWYYYQSDGTTVTTPMTPSEYLQYKKQQHVLNSQAFVQNKSVKDVIEKMYDVNQGGW